MSLFQVFPAVVFFVVVEEVFLCMGVLPVRICTMRAQCPREPEEGTGRLGPGVSGGCKLPCGAEDKHDLLGEQLVCLISLAFSNSVCAAGACTGFQVLTEARRVCSFRS